MAVLYNESALTPVQLQWHTEDLEGNLDTLSISVRHYLLKLRILMTLNGCLGCIFVFIHDIMVITSLCGLSACVIDKGR